MNLIFFVVLLIFGVNPDKDCNTTREPSGETKNLMTCNVMNCESAINKTFIPNMNVTRLKKLQKLCEWKLFASDKYIRVEKHYIDQLIKVEFEGPNKTYEYENFKVTVVKMDMMGPMEDNRVKISAPKLSDDDPPIDVFIPSKPFLNVSENQHKFGVVTYSSAQQFLNDSNVVLKSKVIRIKSIGCEIENLSNQLVINFPVNSSDITPGNYSLSCQFYDETEQKWSDQGSFTNLENFNSSNAVNCSYNYMTVFAVLLVDVQPQQINKSSIHFMDNRTENIFLYNSTELKIAQNLTSLLCTSEGSQCYVECTSANLTTNITGLRSAQLVFNKGENTACSVTKCETDEINALIPNMDLTRLIKAQNMCNKSFALDTYLRAEKDYIDQQINLMYEGPNQTYQHENFKITVFKINMMNSMVGHAKISAPKLSDDDPPIDVFFPIKSFLNDSNEKPRVGIVRYRSAERFTKNSYTVLSEVIRVETVGHVPRNLSKWLFITFPVKSNQSITANDILSCQFYNETEQRWSNKGSLTNLENFNSSNTVNCSYNHMTLFAVLLVKVQLQQKNQSCIDYIDNWTEKKFVYNSTELKIEEKLTSSLCTWEGLPCYVECTPFNLTTNITGLTSAMNLVRNDTIKGQNKTQLVFNMDVQEIECNVTKCVMDEIRPMVIRLSETNDPYDFKRTTRIKNMCKTLFDSDCMKKLYISAEKKYIKSLISAPFNGSSKNYYLGDFNMSVIKMDMMKSTELGLVQISAPKVPNYNLALEVFVPIEPFQSVSEEQRKVAVVTYPSATQFTNNKYPLIEGKVIRVETAGRELKGLSNRLVINFTVNNSEITSGNYTLSCQFYDEKENKWDDMGSFTNLENFNSSNIVSCLYDHMTPFAVLLVDVTQINTQQWKILSFISYIGCSLSALFSAVTILLYVFMKSSNRNTSIHIHVSLSAALFLLNTSFMFIELGATWSQDSLCVLIAVTIQYSLLSCFSWMAIEALHLYLLLIKVFNTYIKHYMVKLSLFGWGVPAVLVGGSLCVYGSQPFYGTKEIQLSDKTAATKFCWITDRRFLYGMNITYFSLTFLFNTCILVIVTHQICKLRYLNIRGSKLPSRKDFCTVLGLTSLLGMTWGLAFLTSGYTNYTVLYLFCICNTLQGFFLFLWFYGTMKRNRSLVKESSTVSKLTRDSVKTSESSFCY